MPTSTPDTKPPDDKPPDDKIKTSRSALLVILLTVFLDLVGFSIIFPLFPDMLEYYLDKEPAGNFFHGLIAWLVRISGQTGDEGQFAATVFFGGLLGSVYSMLQFITAPLWGAVSDRVGRRPILMITVLGITLSYIFWFFAEPFWLLILARILGGAMAGNLSVATAAIADVTDSSNRAKGMGMVGAAFGAGFVIGPAMGALLSLIDATTFWGAIPGVNRFSIPALAACLLSAFNFVFLWKRFPETLQSRTEGVERVKRPLNPFMIFTPSRFPGVNLVNVIYFVFITGFAGMEFTLTFLAKDRFDYSAAQNGFLFLFIGGIVILVQGGLIRRLAPRFGERRLCKVGLGMVLPGMLIVGVCANQFWLYTGVFLLAFGSSLVTPSLTSLVSRFAPAQAQGETLGIFRSIGSFARAFAPLSFAAVYWRFGSQWPYLVAGVVLLGPILLAFLLPRPTEAGQTP